MSKLLFKLLMRAGGFDYYINSVSGSNANDGRTPSTAKQTLGSVTLTAGIRIGLARGSYWREELGSQVTPPSDIYVGAYGSGRMPILDGSDSVATVDWSKTSGKTNVYQVTWSHSVYSIGEFLSVWEDGERLKWVTDTTACDATAGTFFAATTDGTGTAVIYVHTNGSGNPASNSKIYDISTRLTGIYAGSGWTIKNVHTRRSLSNNGSLVTLDGARVIQCLAEDGTKHNLYIGPNSIAVNCIAWKCDWTPRTGATMFVGFAVDGIGKTIAFKNCIAICDIAVGAASVAASQAIQGFYCHTVGDSAKFDTVSYTDCATHGVTTGFGVSNCTQYIEERCYSEGVNVGSYIACVSGAITDPYVRELAGMPHSGPFEQASGDITIDGLRSFAESAANRGCIFAQANGVVEVHHSVIYRVNAGYKFILNANNALPDLRSHHNIVLTDSAASIFRKSDSAGQSDDNVYFPATANYFSGNTSYADFAAWRAAFPSLDTRSVTSDPLLVDPANGNFGVAVGSPAIALGAGLARPNVTYTAIPSGAAIAAM